MASGDPSPTRAGSSGRNGAGREYDSGVNDNARTTPTRIDASRAAGTLQLEWSDGHATTYDAIALRWLCPCAYCRGEAGMPGWLDSNPTLTEAQTQIADVALVGSYAIQVTWGDGHATGFHSFMLLREQCPCAACVHERAQRAADRVDHAAHGAGPGGDRYWHGGDR